MSKLSFRARALDASKPMPIYRKEEVSDLPDYSVLNRAVPQMPTGMEKEEESEHHLQRAISAQQVYGDKKVMVIPVPEAEVGVEYYNSIYRKNFKLPKQLIHNQAQALNSILDQEKPDYDLDSEDEKWIAATNKRTALDITSLQFEEMLDRLEKSCGTQMVSLQEAKLLLKEDDDVIKAVYEYWIKKRSKFGSPLIFTVRQERRDGSSSGDSYVAFRRRTEKMQTRKNRKNDEASYEKMLKLRRDLSRAVTILEMIKRREKSKRELLHLTLEIAEKRYQLMDWDGKLHKSARKETMRQSKTVLTNKHNLNNNLNSKFSGLIVKKHKNEIPHKKTKYGKHKMKISSSTGKIPHRRLGGIKNHSDYSQVTKSTSLKILNASKQPALSYQEVVDKMNQYEFQSSDDEKVHNSHLTPSATTAKEDAERKRNPDGRYAFKRKPGCRYLAAESSLSGDDNWPWMCSDRHRYSLTTLTIPEKCVGFGRRRMGRGGRIHLDRGFSPYTKQLQELDLNPSYGHLPHNSQLQELLEEIKRGRWRRYRPQPRAHGTVSPNQLHDHGTGGRDPVTSLSASSLLSKLEIMKTGDNSRTAATGVYSQQQLHTDSTTISNSKSIVLQNLSKVNQALHYSQSNSTSQATLKLMPVMTSTTRAMPSTVTILSDGNSPMKPDQSRRIAIDNAHIISQLKTAISSHHVVPTDAQITLANVLVSRQGTSTIPTFATKVSMATGGNISNSFVTLTATTSNADTTRIFPSTSVNSGVMTLVQQSRTGSRSTGAVPALLRINTTAQPDSETVPKVYNTSSGSTTVQYTKPGASVPLPSTNANSSHQAKISANRQPINVSVNITLGKQQSGTPAKSGVGAVNSTMGTYTVNNVTQHRFNNPQVITLQHEAHNNTEYSATTASNQANYVSSTTGPNLLKLGATSCAKVSLQPVLSNAANHKGENATFVKVQQPSTVANTIALLNSSQIRRQVKNINRTINISSVKTPVTAHMPVAKQIVLPDNHVLPAQVPNKSIAQPVVVCKNVDVTTTKANDIRTTNSNDNNGIPTEQLRNSSSKKIQPMEVT